MVWNTAQSALYKAVDDFNSRENQSGKYGENCPQKEPDFHTQKNNENESKNYSRNSSKKYSQNCPKSCQKNDPFSRIFSDRDFMLIAGLILILLNEKADQKLIFALLFVLLS